MKTKSILVILLSGILWIISFSACTNREDHQPVDTFELPVNAQAFIRTHFDGIQVVYARKDLETPSESYEVMLNNGIKVDFDHNGHWEEIDGEGKEVPQSVVPVKIATFVKANHPNAFIVKISRDRSDYEVKLLNGIEIKFDARTFEVISYDRDDDDDERPIDVSQLPSAARKFIRTYFNEADVVSVKEDNDDHKKSYEVRMRNGFKLEFDRNGEWKEVDGGRLAVPKGIVPAKIEQFVSKKHPNISIVQISRNRYHYEVELANAIEIKFDAKTFEVIGYDMDDDGDFDDDFDQDDTHIDLSKLPSTARKFIRTYFNEADVVSVEVDNDKGKKSYEVRMRNGFELEFDQNGEWKEVDGGRLAIPKGIVPAKIEQFVSKKHPNISIVQISRNRRHYEVELANGIEIKFDAKTFKFIGYDR
ncbi:PepSY-like domain-containing protein [Porphyromonas macacae]|uniref:PepSY-like domain-containing protein n=1 Tax=Porphyromonas macacae TaxID=28115 RepID=UPI00068AD8C7|nr:PepSY-like domain-containing protein [Porphyromonas macacae]